MMVITTQGVMAANMDKSNTGITIPDYIFECYDGNGYADYPGGVSDLETTLKAVELLNTYQGEWHQNTWLQLDSIAEQYAAMQSPYRGGFVRGNTDTDDPDFQTTALILETLKFMGRMDVINTENAEQYLWSSFRGTLTLKNWISEGLFEDKYWALRAAVALDELEILGIREIDLGHVISPEANLADFPDIDQYIKWNDQFLSGDELYAGGFEDESYDTKLMIIESLDLMMGDKSLSPTLIPSLIDVNSFIFEVENRFDKTIGMVLIEDDIDVQSTVELYRTLDVLGRMNIAFDAEFESYIAVDAVRSITRGLNKEPVSITDVHALSQMDRVLDDTINTPMARYIPRFDDSLDGIASWDKTEETLIVVPDVLWEVPGEPNADQSPLSLIMIVTLFCGVIISAAADNKRLAVILSVFCIFLFFGEYAYGADAIMQQAAAFVGDALSGFTLGRNILNLIMNRWGTIYEELEYPAITDNDEENDDTVDNLQIDDVVDNFEPSWTWTVDEVGKAVTIELETNGPEAFRHLPLAKGFFAEIKNPDGSIRVKLDLSILKGDSVEVELEGTAAKFRGFATELEELFSGSDISDPDVQIKAVLTGIELLFKKGEIPPGSVIDKATIEMVDVGDGVILPVIMVETREMTSTTTVETESLRGGSPTQVTGRQLRKSTHCIIDSKTVEEMKGQIILPDRDGIKTPFTLKEIRNGLYTLLMSKRADELGKRKRNDVSLPTSITLHEMNSKSFLEASMLAQNIESDSDGPNPQSVDTVFSWKSTQSLEDSAQSLEIMRGRDFFGMVSYAGIARRYVDGGYKTHEDNGIELSEFNNAIKDLKNLKQGRVSIAHALYALRNAQDALITREQTKVSDRHQIIHLAMAAIDNTLMANSYATKELQALGLYVFCGLEARFAFDTSIMKAIADNPGKRLIITIGLDGTSGKNFNLRIYDSDGNKLKDVKLQAARNLGVTTNKAVDVTKDYDWGVKTGSKTPLFVALTIETDGHVGVHVLDETASEGMGNYGGHFGSLVKRNSGRNVPNYDEIISQLSTSKTLGTSPDGIQEITSSIEGGINQGKAFIMDRTNTISDISNEFDETTQALIKMGGIIDLGRNLVRDLIRGSMYITMKDSDLRFKIAKDEDTGNSAQEFFGILFSKLISDEWDDYAKNALEDLFQNGEISISSVSGKQISKILLIRTDLKYHDIRNSDSVGFIILGDKSDNPMVIITKSGESDFFQRTKKTDDVVVVDGIEIPPDSTLDYLEQQIRGDASLSRLETEHLLSIIQHFRSMKDWINELQKESTASAAKAKIAIENIRFEVDSLRQKVDSALGIAHIEKAGIVNFISNAAEQANRHALAMGLGCIEAKYLSVIGSQSGLQVRSALLGALTFKNELRREIGLLNDPTRKVRSIILRNTVLGDSETAAAPADAVAIVTYEDGSIEMFYGFFKVAQTETGTRDKDKVTDPSSEVLQTYGSFQIRILVDKDTGAIRISSALLTSGQKHSPADFFSKMMDIYTQLHESGAAKAKILHLDHLKAALTNKEFLDWLSNDPSAVSVRSDLKTKIKDMDLSILSAEDIAFFETLPIWDPGPRLSDISLTTMYTIINWYNNLFVDTGIPDISWGAGEVSVEPFNELGIDEQIQAYTVAWLDEFMADNSLSVEVKNSALSTVATSMMEIAELASDWPYPPYEIAEWRYVGGDIDGWYSTGDIAKLSGTAEFGSNMISQKILMDTEIQTSRLQLYMTDLGDIYNETIEFYVEVWYNGRLATGSTKLRKEGLIEVPLDRQIFLAEGSTVEIVIPIQEATGKIHLCRSAELISEQRDRNEGFSVERTSFDTHTMFVKMEDTEKAGLTGWQKVGTHFESSNETTVDYLIGQGQNYLYAHFRSYPENRLPRSWIAATSFDSETNSTTIKFEEYEFTQTQIYTEIPDNSEGIVPVYIYGDIIPSDLLMTTLMVSGQENVQQVTSEELIDIVYEKRRGVIILLTEDVPYQLFTIDDGRAAVQSWLRAGNQIVSAGVEPFKNVLIAGNRLSAYDYLYLAEHSSPGTTRMKEVYGFSSSESTTTDATTYQCYDSTEVNDTYTIELGGAASDDYIQFKGYKPDSDGSITYMFNMILADVNRTAKKYQMFDVFIDGIRIFDRITIEQLRESNGLGVDGKLIRDDIEDSAGNRIFFQHVGDIVQSDDSVDANFLCYMTVREDLKRGEHIIKIQESADNAASQGQDIRIMLSDNLVSWENRYRPDVFRQIQGQYQGVPEIGAGVLTATGYDMLISADELGRTQIEIDNIVRNEPTTTRYAMNTQSIPLYKVYGEDTSGKYGEGTVRVGSGMFTMLDMEPVNGIDEFGLIAKLNYILTGVSADWKAILNPPLSVDYYEPYVSGVDFEGLIVELVSPENDERFHRALTPNQDFSHDGRYANSFSTAQSLPSVNADVAYDDGYVMVESQSATGGERFSVNFDNVNISGVDATNLVLSINVMNCSVSLNSTQGVIGVVGVQSGIFALGLKTGTHSDFSIVGKVEGENAYFMIDWIGTSEVPALTSDIQPLVENFYTDDHISSVSLPDSTDSWTVEDSTLRIDHVHDSTGDIDGVYFNTETIHDSPLMLEVMHSADNSSSVQAELRITLYTGTDMSGINQTVSLPFNDEMTVDTSSIRLSTIRSIRVAVVSQASGNFNWTIDWLEIYVSSDISITFDNFVGLLSTSLTPPADPPEEDPPVGYDPDTGDGAAPYTPVVGLTRTGSIEDNGDGTYSFTSHAGTYNTWNGTHWVRYVYNAAGRWVKIGNMTIYHNAGGDLSIETNAGVKVGKMKWYIQAYYNGVWNNITLDNYQFVGFTKTEENVSATQRFWGSQCEMNLTLTYTNKRTFKIRADITNWAGQAVPVRAIWSAQQVDLMDLGYTMIKDHEDNTIGVELVDTCFMWHDVIETTPWINVNPVLDKPNKRAAVVFGNMSTVVSPGETLIIDPSYTYYLTNDDYDGEYHYYYDTTTWYMHDTHTANRVWDRFVFEGPPPSSGPGFIPPTANGQKMIPYIGVPLTSIPADAVIDSASFYVYVSNVGGSGVTADVWRVDTTSGLDVENDGSPSSQPGVDTSPSMVRSLTSTGWKSLNVKTALQEHVFESYYSQGNYISFKFQDEMRADDYNYADIYDTSYGSSYDPYITGTYHVNVAPEIGYTTHEMGNLFSDSTGNYTLRATALDDDDNLDKIQFDVNVNNLGWNGYVDGTLQGIDIWYYNLPKTISGGDYGWGEGGTSPYTIQYRARAVDDDGWTDATATLTAGQIENKVNWNYRQEHTVDSGGEGIGTGYHVKVKVQRNDTGTSSGMYIKDKMNRIDSTFDDIRFTDNDGVTQLSHWLEEIDGNTATYWVKLIDDTGSSGSVDIYCYYSNPSASSASDGKSTFIAFDDFESYSTGNEPTEVNGWRDVEYMTVQNVPTGRSGKGFEMHLEQGDYYDVEKATWQWGAGNYDSVAIQVWWYVTNYQTRNGYYSSSGYDGSTAEGAGVTIFGDVTGVGPNREYYPGGSYTSYSPSATYSEGNWFCWEERLKYNYYHAGKSTDGYTWTDHSASQRTGNCDNFYKIAMSSYQDDRQADWKSYWDNFIVRKWVINEPTHPSSQHSPEYIGTPEAEVAPTSSNLDSGAMYAKYTEYLVTVYAEDQIAYSNIDYVELTTVGSGFTWTVRYDETANSFSENNDPSGGIILNTGSSSASRSGSWCNVTFVFYIDWGHQHDSSSSIEWKTKVVNENGNYDERTDYPWNVYSELDLSAFALDDGLGTPDRGAADGVITANGTVVYKDTSTKPLDSEVDARISCSQVSGSPWTDTSVVNGYFELTVFADDVFETSADTYTFEILAGGSDRLHDTHSDTYRVDIITYDAWMDTYHADLGENVNVYCDAKWLSDNTEFTDTYGVVYFGETAGTYSGGVWSAILNYEYVVQHHLNISINSSEDPISTGYGGFSSSSHYIEVETWTAQYGDCTPSSSDSWTLSVWAMLNTTVTGTDIFVAGFQQLYDGAGIYGFVVGYSGTSNRTVGKIVDYPGEYDIYGTSAWNLNEWYHVVLRYNATSDKLELFVNGVSEASTTVTSPTYYGTEMWIGQDGGADDPFEAGMVGEVLFDRKAFTEHEIIELYNGLYPSGLDVKLTGMGIDEVNDEWVDSSGYLRDGTVYGSAGASIDALNNKWIVPAWDTVTWQSWANPVIVNTTKAVEIWVSAKYALTGAPFEGSVSLEGQTMTKMDDGLWAYNFTDTGKSVYYDISLTDNIYGLNSQQGAMYFDGVDDYIHLLNPDELNLIDDFTFSCWFNLDTISSTEWDTLFSRGDTTDGSQSFWIGVDDTNPYIAFWRYDVDDNNIEAKVDYTLSADTWYHLILINDVTSGSVRAWINGVEQTVSVNATAFQIRNVTDAWSTIGMTRSYATGAIRNKFNGFISETTLWSKVLTVAECIYLYKGEFNSPETPLDASETVFHINMISVVFTSLIWYDLSPSGIKGYMINTTGIRDIVAFESVRPEWEEVPAFDGSTTGAVSDNTEYYCGNNQLQIRVNASSSNGISKVILYVATVHSIDGAPPSGYVAYTMNGPGGNGNGEWWYNFTKSPGSDVEYYIVAWDGQTNPVRGYLGDGTDFWYTTWGADDDTSPVTSSLTSPQGYVEFVFGQNVTLFAHLSCATYNVNASTVQFRFRPSGTFIWNIIPNENITHLGGNNYTVVILAEWLQVHGTIEWQIYAGNLDSDRTDDSNAKWEDSGSPLYLDVLWHFVIVDNDDEGPDITTTTDNLVSVEDTKYDSYFNLLNVTVNISDVIYGDTDIHNATLYYYLVNGTITSITMNGDGDGTWWVLVPIDVGHTLIYYIKAFDNDNNIPNDRNNRTSTDYRVSIVQDPSLTFFDDCDDKTEWTMTLSQSGDWHVTEIDSEATMKNDDGYLYIEDMPDPIPSVYHGGVFKRDLLSGSTPMYLDDPLVFSTWLGWFSNGFDTDLYVTIYDSNDERVLSAQLILSGSGAFWKIIYYQSTDEGGGSYEQSVYVSGDAIGEVSAWYNATSDTILYSIRGSAPQTLVTSANFDAHRNVTYVTVQLGMPSGENTSGAYQRVYDILITSDGGTDDIIGPQISGLDESSQQSPFNDTHEQWVYYEYMSSDGYFLLTFDVTDEDTGGSTIDRVEFWYDGTTSDGPYTSWESTPGGNGWGTYTMNLWMDISTVGYATLDYFIIVFDSERGITISETKTLYIEDDDSEDPTVTDYEDFGDIWESYLLFNGMDI
jgi:hypothetical protein